MKNTKVKKLIIELDGQDVELTMAQAKELYASLGELFEKETRLVPKPYPVPYPDPYPVVPWRRRPYWEWPYSTTIWKSSAGSEFKLSDNTMRCQLKSS